MWEMIKNDRLIRTFFIIILGVLGFGLAFNIMFGPARSGMGEGGMDMGHGGMGQGAYTPAFAFGPALLAVFVVVVKILIIVLILGALVGIAMTLKQNYASGFFKQITSGKSQAAVETCPHCSAQVAAEANFCPVCGEKMKQACGSCGTGLKSTWKCCPVCGNDSL